MAPKSKAARKRPVQQQGALEVEQLPLLKKPLEHLGKQIEIPGSFWKGSMSSEERASAYKCTDPNLDPAHLVCLVKVGFNKAAFNPSLDAIIDKYYELFRGDVKAKESAKAQSEAGCSSDPIAVHDDADED